MDRFDSYKALDSCWRMAKDILLRPGETSADRAKSLSCGVGSCAARKRIAEVYVKEWLQSAYSTHYVREFNLDPGLDMKDVVKLVLDVYRDTLKRMEKEKLAAPQVLEDDDDE